MALERAKPRWGQDGVAVWDPQAAVDFCQVIEMLPAKRSTYPEIVSLLNGLRAHFWGWLHQDEFSPTRREQTPALRKVVRNLTAIQSHLDGGPVHLRARLDIILRAENDLCTPAPLIMRAAAGSLRKALQRSGASDHSVRWASFLEDRINELTAQWWLQVPITGSILLEY